METEAPSHLVECPSYNEIKESVDKLSFYVLQSGRALDTDQMVELVKIMQESNSQFLRKL